MKCKAKLIGKACAQWLGVLAHFSVIHTEPDIKSVSTWLNSFLEVVLAQDKAALEADSAVPQYKSQSWHFWQLFSHSSVQQVCPTRTADLGEGKPSQHSPAWSSPTAKGENNSRTRPAAQPRLQTPTSAAGDPDQEQRGAAQGNAPPGQLRPLPQETPG